MELPEFPIQIHKRDLDENESLVLEKCLIDYGNPKEYRIWRDKDGTALFTYWGVEWDLTNSKPISRMI